MAEPSYRSSVFKLPEEMFRRIAFHINVFLLLILIPLFA